MPFKSEAQRRKFYAMASRGEISKETLKEWEHATPKGKKLPKRVKKAAYDPVHHKALITYLKKRGFNASSAGKGTLNINVKARDADHAAKLSKSLAHIHPRKKSLNNGSHQHKLEGGTISISAEKKAAGPATPEQMFLPSMQKGQPQHAKQNSDPQAKVRIHKGEMQSVKPEATDGQASSASRSEVGGIGGATDTYQQEKMSSARGKIRSLLGLKTGLRSPKPLFAVGEKMQLRAGALLLAKAERKGKGKLSKLVKSVTARDKLVKAPTIGVTVRKGTTILLPAKKKDTKAYVSGFLEGVK